MKISTILDQIDLGSIALPVFQRGYVWNREQVRSFMLSLYRRYPIGSFLVWKTSADDAHVRGEASSQNVDLLLDGQQRITTLYGIICGKPPAFFDGNDQVFRGLHFHLEQELFEFYLPSRMKDDPLWIDVTQLFLEDVGKFIDQIHASSDLRPNAQKYYKRLAALDGITDVNVHIEEITGQERTIDVVVDIFNRVNSGGTKLSKGDLALAKICADWPDARHELRARLKRWEQAGFRFKMEWLLRNINAVLTGEANFAALRGVGVDDFRHGLLRTDKFCNYLLNAISARLGLDHDRVLGGRYAFPIMCRYLALNEGRFANARECDKLLYWYVHSFLWGRFSGSTETVLNQDLEVIEHSAGPLDALIARLRSSRGNLEVRPEDFSGWSLGARFYPMLYLLTRVHGARDWCSGLQLSNVLLGKQNRLQVHHIFPKALLYAHGYSRPDVNAIANFCFLTQECNQWISARSPEEYFEGIEEDQPGALQSQWIPMDRRLWSVERFHDFLAARRELLAQAANAFLNSLFEGEQTPTRELEYPSELDRVGAPVHVEDEDLAELLRWIGGVPIAPPEVHCEIADPETGEALLHVDLAWPNGIQEGLSEPIALITAADDASRRTLNALGYRYFEMPDALKQYIDERTK